MLLSDVEGLYDRHPADPASQVIPTVDDIWTRRFADFKRRPPSPAGPNHLSKGGMASKLEAARLATSAGESVVIANGRRPNVLVDIVAGPDGRHAVSSPRARLSHRGSAGSASPPSRVAGCMLDAGAQQAVAKQGRSLLAVGVRRVEGNFQKGDVVSLCRQEGQEIARGLTNYGSEELRRIAGQATERIVEILGHCPYDEVIHRDNLAILG